MHVQRGHLQGPRRRLVVGIAAATLVLVGAVAAAVVALGRVDDAPATSPGPKGNQLQLAIVVRDPDGATRTASMSCAGSVSATGYLAPANFSGSACLTAAVSVAADNILSGEWTVPDDCDRIISTWEGTGLRLRSSGTATITGDFVGSRLSLRLDSSQGPCDSAAWGILEPLLTPLAEERVIDVP